jgi:hypothetical protein
MILTVNFNVQAALVEVSHLPEHNNRAKVLAKILHQNFYIPKAIIKLRESSTPCRPKKNTIVHLCIDTDEEFKMAWINQKRFEFTLAHMIELPPINMASGYEK